ncbi:MAG: UvrD-helicase domain-containing protein [Planctomycetes bacterium]|nr:UvrD-helicase domain-containing protein [Planctomycetota bacterium]
MTDRACTDRNSTERSGTPDQRRGIELKGHDVCVVAGAGTGKTFVLTERVVHRVTKNRLDLRDVLAITFTEKAAAEMKDRLASALEKAGVPGARQAVESAVISTVHSFCARMLRDNAVAAGLDPAFAVLDETESGRLLDESIDALVDEWRENVPADFEQLAMLGGDDPAATLLDVYREAQASGRPLDEFVRQVTGMPDAASAVQSVRDAVRVLEGLRGQGTEAAQKRVTKTLAAAAALGPLGEGSAASDALAAVEAVADSINLSCGEPAKSALAGVREACGAATPVFAEVILNPLREVVARAALRLDAIYHDAKGRGERLDFADLERSAVALLESRDDIRAAVQARWPEVLVDEAQDTNAVQARLVELIRSPARLFAVGDPKQSIYGFRGADVTVFENHLAAVAAQGNDGVVQLRHSFRTRPEVLGFVNRLFRGGLAGMTGPAGVSDLVAGRAWPLADGPCVEVAAFECDEMPEGREAEADWIAERIAALEGRLRIGAPTKEDPLATRTATWGDFAVLLRATTHMKTLESALVAADVPYTVVKGLGFFHAREVVDVALLLGAVDQPRDDIAFASVLRGPACGLSDDALFAISACRVKATVPAPTDSAAPTPETSNPTPQAATALVDVVHDWAAGRTAIEDLTGDDVALLRGFMETFDDLRSRRGAGGVAALVERMFARTRLDIMALGRPNGRQRAANLRKVRVLARDADADGLTLGEFVGELRDLREREVREAEATVAGGARGAVSLMTVHAAKGLEFPVVFVPDIGRSEVVRTGSIVSSARDGIGLKAPADAETDVRPWSFQHLTEQKKAAERAEADRLLYVAVTRTADHLVLSGAVRGDWAKDDPSKENRIWWRRISEALGLTGPVAEPTDIDVGPGADGAQATRVVVRIHGFDPDPEATAPASTAGAAVVPAPAARTLLGRAAASGELAAGVVRPIELRGEARVEASALLTESERVAPPPDGTPYATNVSALTAFARCPQEYRLRHVVGVPEDSDALLVGARTAFDVDESPPAESFRPGDDDEPDVAPSSRAFGRAAHAVLERLVPGFDGDVAREAEVALLAETGGAAPAPEDVAKIVRWISSFRASPLGAEVRAASRANVRREQAFLLKAGRTIVRGQIDLLWRAADGWVVIDWKTGALDGARAEHELQMRLYALGVRAVTGTLPSRSLLWSLPRGRAVEVACGPSDVAETERMLADFSRRAAARAWAPPSDPPCQDCHVRAACRFVRAAPSASGVGIAP